MLRERPSFLGSHPKATPEKEWVSLHEELYACLLSVMKPCHEEVVLLTLDAPVEKEYGFVRRHEDKNGAGAKGQVGVVFSADGAWNKMHLVDVRSCHILSWDQCQYMYQVFPGSGFRKVG